MNLSLVLEQLGADIGLGALSLDADGQCSLLFDGEHEVTFTPNAEDHSLLLHCEVGTFSKLPSEACPELMQASLLGAETGGAALALHRGLDKIILWKRHDENFADVHALRQALEAFLAQAIHWKTRLADWKSSTRKNVEAPSQAEMLNNFDLFV
ncbi:MAG: type III secretion system chaperone [Desulfovibrionaceae bacterium]|nr:type III secretion system chaperone [Desulfovibrionaceae bacterium]